MLRGATLFSGIGAPECAAPFVDWRWCAEIDRFASAVHAARFPGIPNHGDVTRIDPDAVEPVDLVVFGSPCQSFSVAGKRLGLDDPRGNLALVALRLVAGIRPSWVLFENVPGLLSSDGGRDFGAFLGLLGECGYGFAYRVLDAQYSGVPQRRRRVFVVGYLGDWRPPAAVLFERESLQGHPAPSREAREDVAPTISARTKGGGGLGTDFDLDGGLIARAFGGNNTAGPLDVATAVNAHGGPHGRLDFESETFVTHALRAEGFDASEDGTGRGTPLVPVAYRTSPNCGAWETGDPCHPLAAGAHAPAVAFDMRGRDGGAQFEGPHDTANIRAAGGGISRSYVAASAVRRLTPRECERLQGFPDDWTAVTYRGKPAADGNRYKCLGNSMAVPVLRDLLERIVSVDKLLRSGQIEQSPAEPSAPRPSLETYAPSRVRKVS